MHCKKTPKYAKEQDTERIEKNKKRTMYNNSHGNTRACIH